jgi:hypothetical protein
VIEKAPEGFELLEDYDSIEETVFGDRFHASEHTPDDLASALHRMQEMTDTVIFGNTEGNEEYVEILIRIPKHD